jgi:hypothetical protein
MSTAMPQIAFGAHQVSRLILGSNTLSPGSHLSRFVNMQMKRYFTPERVQALLRRCQEVGINTWQGGGTRFLDDLRLFRAQGGQMQYISLAQDDADLPDALRQLLAAGTIGIAHHGEVTDTLWKAGQIDRVGEFLKKIHATGTLAGISTHIPAVVDYVESKGWDVDFYMTCVYERHRTREELIALLGEVPIPVREVYLEGDPARMFRVIQQTRKPCLAFKILAAGRLSERPEMVEQAFESTFRALKPNDAAIVGMYPEYEDQPALNAEYVRRFGALGGQKTESV